MLNYVNPSISDYIFGFLSDFYQPLFFSDNPDILKNILYPTSVSLRMSISHLHVAPTPLFAISASAEYKCQEVLLKPGTAEERIKLRCTSLGFFFSNFSVNDHNHSQMVGCKFVLGV